MIKYQFMLDFSLNRPLMHSKSIFRPICQRILGQMFKTKECTWNGTPNRIHIN